ncbi:N-acetyltransferase [Sphingobacterium mizutaii NBRC 14946 = DSM 11724]|uniref:Predicted acetyltransferase n=3 Tax=Sphingobacterium mizutaii TaxID=1010 RepID=A0AAJ4XB46_9SPHI|nr:MULTISPECIES: N-acetyltransferase [Sphingobacterium]GEM67133.1 N-acetyltransferase [Sphingobacterium mizutaii NBRC 14946 = DSM 11724]SDK97538.1 Predicted N-acetyltransferase YhbS [Sphingobacterium mizutaii]SNV49224.1 Predicted acetyltransferase [Sphingobacterium mizutaii]
MNIRQEEKKDYKEVFKLIENAFKGEKFTDHKEQFLVERLRKSESFIPELSLVAEIDEQIVGYILLTKIKIIDNNSKVTSSLALAPVAVLKNFQGMGIGAGLIKKAHEVAKKLNYGSIILLGHEKYYPKFGYKMMKNYGIKLPFDVPDKNCMLIELTDNALENVQGMVEYPNEFYG